MSSRLCLSSARTSPVANKPPRLALRFAVYTGIALLVVAIAMLWILERDVETRAEQRAVAQTQQIAEAALRRHLQGSDFARPVSRERRRALDAVFRDIVVGGLVRATLFNQNGQVTYSTDHAADRDRRNSSGARECPRRPARARRGAPERHQGLEDLRPGEGRAGRPADRRSRAHPGPGRSIQIVEAFRHTAVILFIALLALWGALIPILRRATAQLHERNRQLVTQANELAGAPGTPASRGDRRSARRDRRVLRRRDCGTALGGEVLAGTPGPSGSSATRPTR